MSRFRRAKEGAIPFSEILEQREPDLEDDIDEAPSPQALARERREVMRAMANVGFAAIKRRW